jgi:thioredoxin:protein disulfide reductase
LNVRRASALAALSVLILTLGLAAWAHPGGEDREPTPPELKYKVAASPSPLQAPGKGTVTLEIEVPTGFHIFSDDTLTLKMPALKGVTWGKPVVPEGKMVEERPILKGTVRVSVPVELAAGAASPLKGTIQVGWQACQDFGDKVCFLPLRDPVAMEVAVKAGPATQAAAPEQPVPEPQAAQPAPPEPAGEGVMPVPSKGQAMPAAPDEGYEARFKRAAKENVPLALLFAFLFGVLSSLTPCVYPVIPITVAYIGSRSEGKGRSAGFLLSLAFVGGLAIVYATLGAVSATAGQAFGSLTQTPWVGLPIAALFFFLSLSMFNLFEFKMPAAFTNRIERTKQKGKGHGFFGAFLIGALSGLVASPCIGPLVLAILVVVAATGSVALGFLYLFVYALGMGVLFIVIGTFAGALASLPKSGGWMDGVRILFGSLILGAAFYFAGLYLPKTTFLVVGLLGLWAVVLFLLFGVKRHFFSVPMRVAGIILCALAFVAILPALPSMAKAAEGGVAWQSSLDAGLAAAKAQGKPALVDMRADWCVACVELEKKTWPEPAVQKWLGTVVPVRLDMTKNTDADQAVMQRYNVRGLPTVLLISPEGDVLKGFVGFKSPEAVLAWAGAAEGATSR